VALSCKKVTEEKAVCIMSATSNLSVKGIRKETAWVKFTCRAPSCGTHKHNGRLKLFRPLRGDVADSCIPRARAEALHARVSVPLGPNCPSDRVCSRKSQWSCSVESLSASGGCKNPHLTARFVNVARPVQNCLLTVFVDSQ